MYRDGNGVPTVFCLGGRKNIYLGERFRRAQNVVEEQGGTVAKRISMHVHGTLKFELAQCMRTRWKAYRQFVNMIRRSIKKRGDD